MEVRGFLVPAAPLRDIVVGSLRKSLGALHARPPAMRTGSELNELSYTIIGAAIEIHRRVGPGCLESAYTPCLALELARRRLDFRREAALTLRYDELVIPRAYFADFIVEEAIVLEVKAVAHTTDRDRRQLQTYLEIAGCPLGLILNFGAKILKDGVTRVVNTFPDDANADPKVS